MRYEITQQITEFLGGALAYAPGACAEVCRRHKINPAIMSRVLNGTKPGVDENTWLKMCTAYPQLRNMAKPYVRKVNKVPAAPLDAFRVRLSDAILKEPRLDDRAKMLVLQIVAEVANAQPSRQA